MQTGLETVIMKNVEPVEESRLAGMSATTARLRPQKYQLTGTVGCIIPNQHRRPRVAASSEERDIGDGVRICPWRGGQEEAARARVGVPESRQDGARCDARAAVSHFGCNFALSVVSGVKNTRTGSHVLRHSTSQRRNERESEKRTG